MCIRMKEYPGLYLKAREVVRTTGINSEMPGYEMLVKAIVIYKVQGTKELYQNVADASSVVPCRTPLTAGEEERHPVKQQILESMRSVGIEEEVKSFVKELASKI